MTYRPRKIISGGQTGADQGALFGATDVGIETAGFAPIGWVTDVGPAPWLSEYGLKEFGRGYPPRTRMNVCHSQGTVLFGHLTSPGTKLTLKLCRGLDRPYVRNPNAIELHEWCRDNDIQILNVAGNRERTNPGIELKVRKLVREAFGVGW